MPPMAVFCLCLAVLTSSIYPVFSSQLGSKGVTATLDAKWPHTSLLLEASEFLAEEGEETFWEFVQTVLDFSFVQALESQLYDLLIKKAAQFLSPVQLSLLKFSLSIRTYSPAVHMCRQLAEEESPPIGCEAFVVVHGQTSCIPEDLTKLLISAGDRPRPTLFKGDHKFPGAGDPPVVVLLYAEIGTPAFSSFHHLLSKLAQAGDLVYVLRHYVKVWLTFPKRYFSLKPFNFGMTFCNGELKCVQPVYRKWVINFVSFVFPFRSQVTGRFDFQVMESSLLSRARSTKQRMTLKSKVRLFSGIQLCLLTWSWEHYVPA
uniref:UDP-glucose glycoprotein glucosyltransferase 2 n=1 Tax=Eptatretus burgeri TaxID=7764 RepID=A0A8C4QDI9_EPTBU